MTAIAAHDGMSLLDETVKALGPISFDNDRDIVQNVPVREVKRVDGKLINVDIATVEALQDRRKKANSNAK